MKRFFIFAMILTVLLGISGLWGDIYYPGTGTYTSIQQCINAATAGETIYIEAGSYTATSQINVNKTVTIQGAGIGETIIQTEEASTAPTNVFSVSANNVTLKNMTIKQRKTVSNNGVESAVTVNKGGWPHSQELDGFAIESCRLESMSFCLTIRGQNWAARNNQFAYYGNTVISQASPMHVGIYGNIGTSYLLNNTFECTNQTPARNIFLFLTSSDGSERYSGTIYVRDNELISGNLSQFYSQNELRGNGLTLVATGNSFNASGGNFVLYGSTPLDYFTSITLVGNQTTNASGKGLLALDNGSGIGSAGSTTLTMYDNTLINTTVNATDYLEATGSAGGLVGYNTNRFYDPNVTIQGPPPIKNTTQGTYFNTIQAAIDAASADDTILVSDGVYPENLQINKTITLKAENQYGATIQTHAGFAAGNGYGGITFLADGSTLDGFTVEQGVVQAVIHTHNANNVTIKNNIIKGINGVSPRGIDVGYAAANSNNVSIYDNVFESMYCGVYINQATNLLIDNNSFENMNESGIVIDGGPPVGSVTITNNSATDSGYLIYFYGDANNLTASDNGPLENTLLSNYKVTNITRGTFHKTIQAGVTAAVAGNVVEVSAGTFVEDVAIDKAITLRGQGNNTIVMGAKGGSTETIFIATSNATVENLAITRDGNNAADWDNANGVLNLTGIQVAQNQTGNIVQNCYLYGNRNAVYLNNARGNTFQNNLIDNNRTGVQLVNNVSNTLIKNNTITNNWTHGFVIYNNAITSPVTGLKVENNNISGNWYSQVECKTVLNPDPYPADTYDFVSNWFGSDTITASSNPAGEPGYSAQIPVEFGGTATPPLGGNDGLICGDLYHKVIYIPWYMDEEMTHKSNETVNNTTKQMWYTSIQAAIDAADPGDEIKVSAGEYNEAVVINKAITLKSVDGPEDTIINRPDGSLTTAVSITGTNLGTVTIDGFTVKGWTESGIVQSMSSGPGTTVNVLNNIVQSNGTYMRNGIQVSGDGSIVTGNKVYGATLTETWSGSGIIVVNADNVLVENNYVTGADVGIAILCYNAVLSPQTGIEIKNNVIEDNKYGIDLQGNYWGKPWNQYSISCVITNNQLKNNEECGIGAGWTQLGGFTVTDNNFIGHPIHVANESETLLSQVALQAILTGNTFDHSYLYDQIIYGNATMLYVDVPKEVIKDGVTQTYSVVASRLDGLRGFKVVVKIPKADFATEPTSLTSGNDFDMMFFDPEHTDDEWIYSVSGTFRGGDYGISGDDVVLFTFDAKSTVDYSNVEIPGCWIELPLDDVVLRGDQNPQNFIPCVDTYDGWVLIDDEDPNVEIVNIADYPDYDENDNPVPYIIQHDGDGMIIPEFDLKYTDDYSLDTAMYLIVPDDATAPTMPGDFSNEVGSVAGIETSINDWPLPIDTLADGTYTIYFLVVDEAGNYSIISWDFVIDNTPPAAIVWDELIPCRTTADANESIDLKWENIGAVVKNHIWVLSYGDAGTNYTHYPEYANHGNPAIVAPADPYGASPQNGWVKFTIDPPTSFPYELTGLPRGYYYITIFASDSAGNMSTVPATPFYRETLNYWPGDVTEDFGAVDGTDIQVLSLAWGSVPGGTRWNPHCDVGPSTDYARRSRPTPDGRIDFEDLMMFSMNYENTNYDWYPRNEVETDPVTITLAYQDLGGLLQVSLYLDGNNGFVTGMDIPVAFGSGLSLQNVEIGDVWPENSLLLHTNENGVVTVSCAAFGAGAVIEGNGLVASLSFAVNGHDNSLDLQRMTARGWDNSEIEIVGNPTGEVANEDLVNVIPDSSYLGSVHPNPFRGSTTLQYGLKEAGSVKLGVYNTRGQLIRNLMNEGKSAGTYQITWDGRDENGLRVSSGIYLFRMETADVIKTQKAMLLK